MIVTQRVALRLTVPLFTYAALACGALRSETPRDARPTSAQPGRISASREVLSADELRTASGANALEVVQRLRPEFLRSRGPLHAPKVFVDHMPIGGVSELRTIPVGGIREIRYLNARVATQEFGTGYSGGVIHVLSVSGPR